jgi:phage/plasmid-like protein (TIGR03299 family)
MPAELATTNGRAAMAYVRSEGTPWHGLGTPVEDAMEAREAIVRGGLAYAVESQDCYAAGPDGPIAVPNVKLNVRGDTLAPLGVVSDQYQVVQNTVAFGFLDSIVAEGGLRYHTVGALSGGRRIWLLGKVPGHIRVAGDDVVDKFLLLYNSHDGSSALRVLFTPVRVVCANTVAMALEGAKGAGYSFRHTGDLDKKIEEARAALGMASAYFTKFGEGAALLAGHRPSRAWVDRYFETLYPDPEKTRKNDAALARQRGLRMTLNGLFERGMGQDIPEVKGTAWAAYNAVTEYLDWHVPSGQEVRLRNSWFGDGAKVRAKAFDLAVTMTTRPNLAMAGGGTEAADEALAN